MGPRSVAPVAPVSLNTRNYLGAVLGAALVLVGINEGSRFLPNFFDPTVIEALRGIIIGVLMILVLKFKPDGLLSESRIHLYKRSSRAPAINTVDPQGSAAEAPR